MSNIEDCSARVNFVEVFSRFMKGFSICNRWLTRLSSKQPDRNRLRQASQLCSFKVWWLFEVEGKTPAPTEQTSSPNPPLRMPVRQFSTFPSEVL
jgi:hypothetical protein